MTNSKQINYYITEEEIERFDDYLFAVNAKVIGLPLPSEIIKTLPSIKALVTVKPNWPLSFRLVHETMVNEIKIRHVEKQGYYLIDTLRSPILEMSKCYFDIETKSIGRARIYFQSGYYDDNNQWIDKDKDFIAWADDIIKEFSRNYVGVKTTPTKDFISKDVLHMINHDGWKLID